MEMEETPAMARIVAQIARDRPVAIAGPAEFWARITGLAVDEAAAALETLAERGVVRRQALGKQRFFVADPPRPEGTGQARGGIS
jgi:hypothetical protein